MISYVRRIAQARLDLLDAEMQRRTRRSPGRHRRAAADPRHAPHRRARRARRVRPSEASDHPLALELEELCARLGADDVKSLDDAEVDELRIALLSFEQARSQERQELFDRLDALSAELVRRYREGEADVDGLLADD